MKNKQLLTIEEDNMAVFCTLMGNHPYLRGPDSTRIGFGIYKLG